MLPIVLALVTLAPTTARSQATSAPAGEQAGQPTSPPTAAWQVLGAGAGLRSPMGVAVDGVGTIYVADAGNHRVMKLGPEGRALGAWGSQGGAPGQFDAPAGIAVDVAGWIYVVDTFNHRVQKLSPDGQAVLVVGEAGTGPGQFRDPSGIAVDLYGRMYVADTYNNRVQKLGPDGVALADWGTPDDGSEPSGASRGRGVGGFRQPKGVAADAYGRLIVADTNNFRIVTLSAESGEILGTWSVLGGLLDAGATAGLGRSPRGVAVDAYGRVYVADTDNHRVQLLETDGTPLVQWGGEGGGVGEFRSPSGVALDGSGALYVADTGNHRIQRLVTRGG